MSAGDSDWGSPAELFLHGHGCAALPVAARPFRRTIPSMATETAQADTPSTSSSTPPLESFNPATGEVIGAVETITPEQVQGVVDEVALIQPAWAELSRSDRATYLKRAATVLHDRLDEIASLLSREQGKPISECYTMELIPSIDAMRWCAKEGPGILKD